MRNIKHSNRFVIEVRHKQSYEYLNIYTKLEEDKNMQVVLMYSKHIKLQIPHNFRFIALKFYHQSIVS